MDSSREEVRYAYRPAEVDAWAFLVADNGFRRENSIAVDPTGGVHIGIAGARRDAYGTATDGLATGEIDPDAGELDLGAVAIDAAGGTHVSYARYRAPWSYAVRYAYRARGEAWTLFDVGSIEMPHVKTEQLRYDFRPSHPDAPSTPTRESRERNAVCCSRMAGKSRSTVEMAWERK